MLRWLGRLAIRICALLGILVLIVTLTPVVSWYGAKLAGQWTDPNGDTLIVLGGDILPDDLPGTSTLWRCWYALRAYKNGYFRKIVVAGSHVSHGMREILTAEGVPAPMVIEENASTSTHQNAVYVARLLAGDHGTKVLLTSDYHMFRAARAFRKSGLDVLPRPIPDADKRATRVLMRWPVFLDEGMETAKIAYYFVRGWI